MHFVLTYGSVRRDRMGIRVVRFLEREIGRRGHDTSLLDPIELRLPLLDRMYKEYPPGDAPDSLERAARLIRSADAFVHVTGEYNHNVPPGLANLLDHFLEAWFWRPSAIASYSAGSFGGVRAAVVLREMLAEMGMPSIPSTLPVPRVQAAFSEDGEPQDDAWQERTTRFLSELEWYAEALGHRRAEGTPY